MSTKFVRRVLSTCLSRFAKCERAAIAPMFAIILVPLVVMGGAGLDFTRAYIAKVRLAGALDAAALAVGSTECTTTDPTACEAELNVVLNNYFYANYPNGGVGVPIANDLSMTLSADFDVVSVAGAAQVPTTFLHFVGMDMLTVRVDIEAIREVTGLEVALVLDNTGSMAGSKIVELRGAAHDLVDLVFGSFTAEPHPNVYVGVVPFNGTVNIGTSNSSLIEFPPNTQKTMRYDHKDSNFTVGEIVTGASGTAVIVENSCCSGSSSNWRGTLTLDTVTGTFSVDEWVTDSAGGHAQVRDNPALVDVPVVTLATWIGCVEARPNGVKVAVTPGDDVLDTSPVDPPTGGGLWAPFAQPGVSNMTTAQDGCSTSILPLDNYLPDVSAKIDLLNSVGGSGTQTNTGAIWGWRVVSPEAPFTLRTTQGGASDGPIAAYDDQDFNKAVVLMTDGENNYDTYTAYGLNSENRLGLSNPSSSSEANTELNDRMTYVCNQMKAQGILVFTVVFDLSSVTVENLMRDCASEPEYFYDTQAGNNSLSDAFKAIGAQLSNLRLSK